MSITATVVNDTIKLPIHVPDGTTVEILLPQEAPTTASGGLTLSEQLKDFVGCITDGPTDLAEEHDHYAHGTPKRY